MSLPLYGEDNEAATRQYNVAVSLQNREAYDLAIDAWGSFIKAYPADPRVNHARHYQGVCYFFTAVGALDAKPQQTDAALKSFDAAEQSFDAVVKAAPRFELLEDTYLYLGLSQFKRGKSNRPSRPPSNTRPPRLRSIRCLRSYPQSKNLAQVLYTRGDCAYHAGQKADAVRFYSQALTKSPNEKLEPAIMYALGVAQEELKQWEAAGKTYDDFLKKYLDHRNASEIIMRRGETLFRDPPVSGGCRLACRRRRPARFRIGRFRHHAAGRGPGPAWQARRSGRYPGRNLHEVPQLDAVSRRAENGPCLGPRPDP